MKSNDHLDRVDKSRCVPNGDARKIPAFSVLLRGLLQSQTQQEW